MKNLKNFFFLLIAACFVFAACNNDLPSNSTLAVTGLPSKYNGQYVFASGTLADGTNIYCGAEAPSVTSVNDFSYKLSRISDGKVNLIVYTVAEDDSAKLYTGNGTFEKGELSFLVFKNDTITKVDIEGFEYEGAFQNGAAIAFSNGAAKMLQYTEAE